MEEKAIQEFNMKSKIKLLLYCNLVFFSCIGIICAFFAPEYKEISSSEYVFLMLYDRPEIKVAIRESLKDNKITVAEHVKIIKLSKELKNAENSAKIDSVKQILKEVD